MPYADVNGQHLYYEDTGGHAPAIIFSHGLLMDHRMFEPQVNALSGKYRCITWDERGHGNTAKESIEPFTYYDSANDLAALLEHLDIEKAILVGMSQGGYLSLRCALTHPERVRALVLIDSQALPEAPETLPRHRALVEEWSSRGLSEESADTIADIIIGRDWPGAEAWKDRWKQKAAHDIAACFTTLDERDDIQPRLGEINVPALVIHGTADQAIPTPRAQAMADALPQARLELIDGAPHAANLTHSERVNTAIQAFLATL
ncbi:alpha/beta hydrolase [Halomonas shantousis]